MWLKYISLGWLLVVVPLRCQTVAPSADQRLPTFQSKVPVVLVDIIVTDNHGNPVAGLTKTDFQLLEDGKPQTIASLEEHKTRPVAPAEAPVAAGVITNSPAVVSSDSVNVLLIDGLNTGMQDQTFVHAQILRYLKSIPPGTQAAVFLLTTRLRMLQGFTTDSSALLAAVNSRDASTAFASPLLQSESEKQSLQETVDFMEANAAGPPPSGDLTTTANSINPGNALKQAFAEIEVRLTEARLRLTLESMQALGRYLAAFPGRKNVMWVSGSFPIAFLPNPAQSNPFFSITGFQNDIQRTANLLSRARVAIYPVAAAGLIGSRVYQADTMGIGGPSPGNRSISPGGRVQKDVSPDQPNQQSMEELANGTGGRAFYGTNGIGDVLTRVTHDSANFYTLSYSPTDRQMDGKYRHISIKLTSGKEKLSYRRGYFALREENAAQTRETDPLLLLMAFGMPDMSQIIYKARLGRLPGQAEDAKKDLLVPVKDPVKTYAFDLELFPDQLQFEVTSEGVHNAKIQVKLVLYDETGKVLNVVGGRFGLTYTLDEFEKVRQEGLQLRERIEIPANSDARLYSGICDLNSGRIGTLAMRLHDPKTSAANK